MWITSPQSDDSGSPGKCFGKIAGHRSGTAAIRSGGVVSVPQLDDTRSPASRGAEARTGVAAEDSVVCSFPFVSRILRFRNSVFLESFHIGKLLCVSC